MKITPRQYARSLYEVIDGKAKKESKEAIDNFVRVLVAQNAIFKLDRIINEFEKVWSHEKGIVDARIISAKKLGGDLIKVAEKYIKDLSGAKEVVIEKEEDKKLLGGVIIKYGDKILDGSLKTRLEDLKNKMIK